MREPGCARPDRIARASVLLLVGFLAACESHVAPSRSDTGATTSLAEATHSDSATTTHASTTVTDSSKESGPCDHAQTQAALNTCWGNEARKTDSILVSIIDSTKQQLGTRSSVLRSMELGQLAWVRYRDAHCQAVRTLFDGGSIATMAFNQCRAELTSERVSRLRSTFLTDSQ